MLLPLDCVPIGYDNEHQIPIVASNHNEFLIVLKQHRNAMLGQSDWRIGVDSPLSAEEVQEWIIYRQYLRDLTKNIPDVLSNSIEINDPPASGGPIFIMDKLPGT